jgi:outer membrane murein-binding lipoprotein Lpp
MSDQKNKNMIPSPKTEPTWVWKAALWVVMLFGLVAFSAGSVGYVSGEKIRRLQGQVDSLSASQKRIEAQRDSLRRVISAGGKSLPAQQREDILWMTRALLSETKRPSEMPYIASVIRNRVETRYRGSETVKQVVLDQYQFSAFNPGRSSRSRYLRMDRSTANGYLWDVARSVSEYAVTAPRAALPFTSCVTHFVYPNVLKKSPKWRGELEQVNLGGARLPRVEFYRKNSRCNG